MDYILSVKIHGIKSSLAKLYELVEHRKLWLHKFQWITDKWHVVQWNNGGQIKYNKTDVEHTGGRVLEVSRCVIRPFL